MRILYHHRTLGDGAEGIHIAEMVNAFRQLGHEVLVIGPGIENVNGVEKRTGRFAWVKRLLRGPFYELAELGYNIIGYKKICKTIRDFQPDFIYDRYITFNYSAIAAGEKFNLPVFLEVNAPLAYEREHEPDERLYFKRLAYFIEKKACCDSYKTIVVSTPLKNYLCSKGVPSHRIKVLPNGVNIEKFIPKPKPAQLLKKFNIKKNNTVIGFTGILRPWHGIELLIKAFKILLDNRPNSLLLLIGDGPVRSEIEKLADEVGVASKLIITGRVPHYEIGDYLALLDIAVSPKATFYASPMKIIEYMAQKKAVIAPDSPNIRDLIENNITGLLFKDGSSTSLAAALLDLSENVQQRKKLEDKALAVVKEKLNWTTNAKIIIKLYDDGFRA